MSADREHIASELRRIVQIGSALLDGDELRRSITPRSYWYMANQDPDFRSLAGDFYDVDHGGFLRCKKLLLRLETLVDFTASSTVWLLVPGMDKSITALVKNGDAHRYSHGKVVCQPLDPEMEPVIDQGSVLIAPDEHPSGLVTAIGPIRNSFDEVVGVLEISARSAERIGLAARWR